MNYLCGKKVDPTIRVLSRIFFVVYLILEHKHEHNTKLIRVPEIQTGK